MSFSATAGLLAVCQQVRSFLTALKSRELSFLTESWVPEDLIVFQDSAEIHFVAK